MCLCAYVCMYMYIQREGRGKGGKEREKEGMNEFHRGLGTEFKVMFPFVLFAIDLHLTIIRFRSS